MEFHVRGNSAIIPFLVGYGEAIGIGATHFNTCEHNLGFGLRKDKISLKNDWIKVGKEIKVSITKISQTDFNNNTSEYSK